jgi:hypothetical protein
MATDMIALPQQLTMKSMPPGLSLRIHSRKPMVTLLNPKTESHLVSGYQDFRFPRLQYPMLELDWCCEPFRPSQSQENFKWYAIMNKLSANVIPLPHQIELKCRTSSQLHCMLVLQQDSVFDPFDLVCAV